MRISRLHLRDLRRHADLELHLAPGLTVIRGPNEAGKSTVQRALELALFRRVTAAGQEMDATRRWGAPASADPSVEMDFIADGRHGRLVKSFGGARGRAELTIGDETLNDPAAVDARLAKLTGLPSEKFFRSTACVRHQELAGLDRDEGALRDRLQMSMSGADRGTHAAKRKLEEGIRRLKTEGAKNPGPLRTAREEIASLTAAVGRDEQDLGRLAADRQALTRARAERAEIEGELRAAEEQLQASERALELLGRATDARARYERYRRAAELREQVADLEAAHPSTVPLTRLRPSVERLRGLEYTISELRAELASEPDMSGYDVAIPAPRWRPWAVLAALLFIIAVAVTFGGVAAGLGQASQVVALGTAAVGVVVLLWVFRQLRGTRDVRRQNLMREDEVSRRLRGRSERAHELAEIERQRDAEVAGLELPDLATAEDLLARETEHVASIDRFRAEEKGLLGGEQLSEDVAILRDRNASEAEQMRHALTGMGEIGADPEKSRERYASAVAATRTRRETAMEVEGQALGRVDANPVDAEQAAGRAELLAAAEENLAALERRLRIYEKTLRALNDAEQATMKKAARFLEQRISADVERITGGRYRRVRVDEAQLDFSVWSPEREDWVDVRSLSQGTLDQFYLAARLGLVRQVTEERRPPLVFDDPFLSFDDERARRAVDLLKTMAGDHQVIYLTCSDRYDSVADAVIVLPPPTETDDRESGEPILAAAEPA